MFIRIKFKKSDTKNYLSTEDWEQFRTEKTIPSKELVNVFSDEQVRLLNSILDKNLETEQMKTFLLEEETLTKNIPYVWGDEGTDKYKESVEKKHKYNDKYDSSDYMDLYTVTNTYSYIVDSSLLFSVVEEIQNTGMTVVYEVISTLKDLQSTVESKENQVLSKILSLEKMLNNFSNAGQFNTKVGVHISDLGLLNVKEVDVVLDPCTDELQKWLNEGWRILSICPQPDQRRPDYIVGRNERMADRKRRDSTCN